MLCCFVFAEKIVVFPSDAFDLKVQKLRACEVSWKSFSEARFVAAGLWPVASSGRSFIPDSYFSPILRYYSKKEIYLSLDDSSDDLSSSSEMNNEDVDWRAKKKALRTASETGASSGSAEKATSSAPTAPPSAPGFQELSVVRPPATLLIELDGETETSKTSHVGVKASGAELAKVSTVATKSTAVPSSQVKRKGTEGASQQQSEPKKGRTEDRGKAMKGPAQQPR